MLTFICLRPFTVENTIACDIRFEHASANHINTHLLEETLLQRFSSNFEDHFSELQKKE